VTQSSSRRAPDIHNELTVFGHRLSVVNPGREIVGTLDVRSETDNR
jgi:hypothetical protein